MRSFLVYYEVNFILGHPVYGLLQINQSILDTSSKLLKSFFSHIDCQNITKPQRNLKSILTVFGFDTNTLHPPTRNSILRELSQLSQMIMHYIRQLYETIWNSPARPF